jgi:hypothetical protein
MPSPQGKATEGRMFASVALREVLARLRLGVAKPQVKPVIRVFDPCRMEFLGWVTDRLGVRRGLGMRDREDRFRRSWVSVLSTFPGRRSFIA